jgi:hypothetical protein
MPHINSMQFYLLGKESSLCCVNKSFWHSQLVAGEDGDANSGRNFMSRDDTRPVAGQLHSGRQDQAMRRSIPGFDSRADGRSTPQGAAEGSHTRFEMIRDEVVNAIGGLAAAVPVMMVAASMLTN